MLTSRCESLHRACQQTRGVTTWEDIASDVMSMQTVQGLRKKLAASRRDTVSSRVVAADMDCRGVARCPASDRPGPLPAPAWPMQPIGMRLVLAAAVVAVGGCRVSVCSGSGGAP